MSYLKGPSVLHRPESHPVGHHRTGVNRVDMHFLIYVGFKNVHASLHTPSFLGISESVLWHCQLGSGYSFEINLPNVLTCFNSPPPTTGFSQRAQIGSLCGVLDWKMMPEKMSNTFQVTAVVSLELCYHQKKQYSTPQQHILWERATSAPAVSRCTFQPSLDPSLLIVNLVHRTQKQTSRKQIISTMV